MNNEMKNVLVFCFFVLFSFTGIAQEKDKHRERIKALKTAHITEGLNLTPREAQQFWPVYNEYEQKRRSLYRQEHADIPKIECVTEESAAARIEEYIEIEKQDYLLKKKYYSDLRKIFSAKRIIQLKKVEDEFNEKMMREYRARRAAASK
jgi:hypothetical protein